VTHTNVTAGHAAAERQRELTAHFRAVFDHAVDGILIADDEGRCVEANEAAARLLGRTAEDMLGLDLREVYADFEHIWPELLRNGELNGSLRLDLPGRPPVDIDYSSRAGFFPGRHLSVLRDVTAARRAEEQLRQAQKMEAVGQLASGIAHDFNNLLTVVIGNVSHVDDLLDGPEGSGVPLAAPMAGVAKEDLRKVMWAAERGADLVKKLLAFGRKQRFQPTRLSVTGFVRDLQPVLRRLVPENIRVDVDAPHDLMVLADGGALQQIVFNLATNARDAIGPGDGVIRIRVAPVTGAGMSWIPPAVRGQRFVALTVGDNGCGMDPDTLRHICEPFFTTKGVGEGSGLGMAMVYGLVQQHGGHMHVQSCHGAGTTVYVLLPLLEGRPEAPVVEAPRRGAPVGGHERVLVVEDEPAVRDIAARTLKLAGYRVLTATDSIDAVAVLHQHGNDIDLVVSDLVMPGGGGPAVVNAVTRLAPRARLLLTSGYPSRPSQAATPDELTGIPLLQKPWTPSELQSTARRILDERRT
jgi:signal transduction histidine kinase